MAPLLYKSTKHSNIHKQCNLFVCHFGRWPNLVRFSHADLKKVIAWRDKTKRHLEVQKKKRDIAAKRTARGCIGGQPVNFERCPTKKNNNTRGRDVRCAKKQTGRGKGRHRQHKAGANESNGDGPIKQDQPRKIVNDKEVQTVEELVKEVVIQTPIGLSSTNEHLGAVGGKSKTSLSRAAGILFLAVRSHKRPKDALRLVGQLLQIDNSIDSPRFLGCFVSDEQVEEYRTVFAENQLDSSFVTAGASGCGPNTQSIMQSAQSKLSAGSMRSY